MSTSGKEIQMQNDVYSFRTQNDIRCFGTSFSTCSLRCSPVVMLCRTTGTQHPWPREWNCSVQRLSHFKHPPAQVFCATYISRLQVLRRWASGEATGGDAVDGSSLMRSLYKARYNKADPNYLLSRREQVTVLRLRTGHNCLNYHLYSKLRIGHTEQCSCGTGSQTTEHLLQSCPTYEPLRKGIWPDHTPVVRKLYRSLRDLRCTATFIEETGVSIWRTRRRRGCSTKNQEKKPQVGAWNARTLLDRDNTARPERRTALIAKELARYRIDITALSETRLADEGILKEDGGGYTFFWRGKPEAEERVHGVGFAIRTSLMKSILSLPVGINERLMKLHLPLSKSRHLTIISAYAPTLTNSDETKEKFYDDLDQPIRSTSPNDKLLILCWSREGSSQLEKDTWISRCWEN